MTALQYPLVIFSVIFALCVILLELWMKFSNYMEKSSCSSQSNKTLENMNAFRIKTKNKRSLQETQHITHSFCRSVVA